MNTDLVIFASAFLLRKIAPPSLPALLLVNTEFTIFTLPSEWTTPPAPTVATLLSNNESLITRLLVLLES